MRSVASCSFASWSPNLEKAIIFTLKVSELNSQFFAPVSIGAVDEYFHPSSKFFASLKVYNFVKNRKFFRPNICNIRTHKFLHYTLYLECLFYEILDSNSNPCICSFKRSVQSRSTDSCSQPHSILFIQRAIWYKINSKWLFYWRISFNNAQGSERNG